MDVFTKVIDVLLNAWVGLSHDNYISLVMVLFTMAGMWGIFKKCGLKPWHALVPCLRDATLGQAAGMEREGRILASTNGLMYIANIINIFLTNVDGTSNSSLLFQLATILIGLIHIIYLIKVYLGLCEVFGKTKRFRWLVLWIIADCIPSMLWGWSDKYQPLWKAEDLKHTAVNYFSGSKAAVLDQGLTVNLEERTARPAWKRSWRSSA